MKLILSDRSLALPSLDSTTQFIDLSQKKIKNCVGCFGCWTKTPGKCVIRDDATTIYPLIASSNRVIYISKIKYGSYDTIMDIVNGLNAQAANRELTCKLIMLINLTAMSIILAVQQMTQLVEYFSRNERLIGDIHDLYQKYINIGNA